jgi:peptide/nickel transport system substrate-binding protein
LATVKSVCESARAVWDALETRGDKAVGDQNNIEKLWQMATPTTRREILKKAGIAGIAAPAMLAMLKAPGALAAPGSRTAVAPLRAQEPVDGGQSVWLAHQEIASLSPDDTGPSMQFILIANIHNPLVQQDENVVFQPILAESWTQSDDGLTYTFKLHTGVTFQNGDPFSSADVKYTYEYFMNPENVTISGVDFEGIEKVEAPDDATVVVTLKTVFPAFIAKVATMQILPSKYHAEIGEEAYKGQPIGTGAFKLKEWRPAEYTLLEAYEDHFRGRPHLDEIRMNVVPEASVRAIALETGDADTSAWPLVTEDNLRLIEDPQFKFYKTSSWAVNHFPLNNTLPQLSDKKVRQAMMFAIDRQKVIDDIFKGTAVVATSNLTPALTSWYTADVTPYAYNVDTANSLLDEAGWTLGSDGVREKDGQKLSFTCTTISGDQARRPEAEVVQQYLKVVGIDMQLEEAPVSGILDGLRNGDMQASLFNWTYGGDNADPDAQATLSTDGANNFCRYSNARVDELLTAGLQEPDAVKRKAIYDEVQQIVADEVPFLFMMFWDIYTIFNVRVQGLPDTLLASDPIYLKANEWWIAQ